MLQRVLGPTIVFFIFLFFCMIFFRKKIEKIFLKHLFSFKQVFNFAPPHLKDD